MLGMITVVVMEGLVAQQKRIEALLGVIVALVDG